MATRFFSLTRIVLTNKQALPSFLTRSYAVSSTSLTVPPVRVRSLTAVSHLFHGVPSTSLSGFRAFSTRHTQSSMNDSNPNWSNRPPKETILLDGCDFEHWLVVVEKPDENATRDEIIASYIETLAKVVGSAEEARMKIYSVSTRHYFAFGALVSEELSYKLKELPNVRWVLPDSYLDVRNKDYGGEPFIDGQAVPYDPKYHEEWVRNNAKAMERNRRNDRPRNFDRSRNFERRRQNVQDQGPPMPTSNQPPQSAPPNNMPGNNMGTMHPSNTGSAPNQGWQRQQGNAPNFPGGGYPQAPPPNYQNYGGPSNNFRGPPPQGGYPQNPQGGNQGYPQNLQGGNQGYPQNPQGGNQGYPQNPQGGNQGYPQNPEGGNQGYPQNPQGGNQGYSQNPQGGNQGYPPNYGANTRVNQDMPPMPTSPRNY